MLPDCGMREPLTVPDPACGPSQALQLILLAGDASTTTLAKRPQSQYPKPISPRLQERGAHAERDRYEGSKDACLCHVSVTLVQAGKPGIAQV